MEKQAKYKACFFILWGFLVSKRSFLGWLESILLSPLNLKGLLLQIFFINSLLLLNTN
jgi:hypothetical protein